MVTYGKDWANGTMVVKADDYTKLTLGMEPDTDRDMSSPLAGSTLENEPLCGPGSVTYLSINGFTAD